MGPTQPDEVEQFWKRGKIRHQLHLLAYLYEVRGASIGEICFLLNRSKQSVKNQIRNNALRRKETPSVSRQALSDKLANSYWRLALCLE